MSTPTRRYRAAGGVVVAGDRVAVLLRPARGEVRLPKGRVEPDETDEQTALREVAEETGFGQLEIVDDLGERVTEYDHLEDDGSTIHIIRDERYFLMNLAGPDRIDRPAEDEEQFTVDLLPVDEAIATLTYEGEREWVRRALAHQGT